MIRVEYGFTAEGAKEEFVPKLSSCAKISNADDLLENNLVFKNFTNPCEKYSTLLDGSCLPIPKDTTNENMGVWSSNASNENGEFTKPLPTVVFTSEKEFDIEGLTLTFDIQNDIFPTDLLISWYNNDKLIETQQYNSNSSTFALLKSVKSFNKMSIVFNKMNMPFSRLKFRAIEYGSIIKIEGKNIKNMRFNHQVNPLSATIPIGTLELSFINSSNVNYNFETRQMLTVYSNNINSNDMIMGTYFIEIAKQVNKQQWNIKAQDYISILESTEFEGGIYENELALNILTNIFDKARVPFTLDKRLLEERISGYIPYTTCRKALQQVLFAIGAYAKTQYNSLVDIEANIEPSVIPYYTFEQMLSGQTVSVDADITEIELFAHSYAPISDEIVLHQAGQAVQNAKILFNEPVHNLTIESGEILEQGVNYAIISCTEQGILKGQKYEHLTYSKSKFNETTLNKNSDNKKTIKNATLISYTNIDKILDLCYNYIIRNKTVRSKIIDIPHGLNLGRTYEVETELFGKIKGVLIEQTFSLYGGEKVVKETVIK